LDEDVDALDTLLGLGGGLRPLIEGGFIVGPVGAVGKGIVVFGGSHAFALAVCGADGTKDGRKPILFSAIVHARPPNISKANSLIGLRDVFRQYRLYNLKRGLLYLDISLHEFWVHPSTA